MTIRRGCAADPPFRLIHIVTTYQKGAAALDRRQTADMTEQSPVTDATAVKADPKKPAVPDAQTVTDVQHWTDRLFSFRVTRPASLRFRSGEFVMIGLMTRTKRPAQKPLLRAYSIASPSWDDELEFYSIKVQDGPLTSRLQHIEAGDQIILRPEARGHAGA